MVYEKTIKNHLGRIADNLEDIKTILYEYCRLRLKYAQLEEEDRKALA